MSKEIFFATELSNLDHRHVKNYAIRINLIQLLTLTLF